MSKSDKVISMLSIDIEKQLHHGWVEWNEARIKGQKIPKIWGKWQYIYSSPKGTISLVQFLRYMSLGRDKGWEIFCLLGNLFEDVEKFDSKKQAEKRIIELLEW